MVQKIYIAGQEGMVGQAIYKLLKEKKYKIIECKRKQLDLVNQKKVKIWFKKNKPTVVINAAGKVGGILDNSLYPNEYLYINTMIGLNLVKSSLDYNVKQFINLGSACIYPKVTKQPINEQFLLSSKLEESNEGYAIAKIAVLKYCEYLQKKRKKNFFSLQPANLYGEGDNFDLKSSHVIPALIRKFYEAKINNKKSVEVWGSGLIKREFLNVKDLAEAVVFLINKKIPYGHINVGGSEHITIKKLSFLIKEIVQFKGKIIFNKKYPDGVKERRLNVKLINKLGWKYKIKLKEGLKNYYKYFLKIYPKVIIKINSYN
jgi:GDP-L-fucose synthase